MSPGRGHYDQFTTLGVVFETTKTPGQYVYRRPSIHSPEAIDLWIVTILVPGLKLAPLLRLISFNDLQDR